MVLVRLWAISYTICQHHSFSDSWNRRNRYPGARFDSESYSYIFSFSQEVLDEWNWTEHFSPQPETLKYCQYLCDRFDLRGDMQFDTRISAAHYQDTTDSWLLTDENGNQYSSRFLLTAMGILNRPTLPNIPGVHEFQGPAFHTAQWPSEVADLSNKRVGIIGTGATAIQTVQEIVKSIGHLTVFQRTPNWSAPLRNAKITPEEMQDIRKQYPDIFAKCAMSHSCFMHQSDPRSIFDVTLEEREARLEELYGQPGFAKWVSNFRDMSTDRAANAIVSEFFARKIRERVHDPVTAEKLIPKCHGFGTRRVPLESGYFEAFNRPNVRLHDLKEDPIECITRKGIKTQNQEIELDIIIYATGFDAVTGSFNAVDFQGVGERKLKDTWGEGIKTYLGFTIEGFPNMFMSMGPHQMFGNIPRSIEYAVTWISTFIEFCRDRNIIRVEATPEGAKEWTEHVHDCAKGLLANEVDSWMTGVNKNLAHKQVRTIARYNGPGPGFRKRCDEVAARNYADFKLKAAPMYERLSGQI